MKRRNKLPQNFDSKVLSINHIGSKGEGVSYLHTEFNYEEKKYIFFIPFSLPNEIIIKGIKKRDFNNDKSIIKKELNDLINAGLSLSAASKYLAKRNGLKKSEIYNMIKNSY